MWSNIVIDQTVSPTPPNRCKQAVAFDSSSYLYLYGGKSGTFPLKDLWRLDLRGGTWTNLKPEDKDDAWPPPLQEHSMIYNNGKLYMFGGEIGMSDDFITPLWIYNIKDNIWRKWKSEKTLRGKGLTPIGRRGHTASVYSNYMIIYGGYRDLKGSLGDLWAFHFETESWHLFWKPSSSRYSWAPSSTSSPTPRHNHSAIQHGQFMYIYGGMYNLEEKADCWKYDFTGRKWWIIKRTKNSPGSLRGHCASKALGSMFLIGGERDGKPVDEFWRMDFNSETWERLQFHSTRPCPRVFPACIMLPALVKLVHNTQERRVSSSSSNKYWWDEYGSSSSSNNSASRPLKNINIIRDFSNRINCRSSSAYQVLESNVAEECGEPSKNNASPVNETLRPIHEEKLIEFGDEDSIGILRNNGGTTKCRKSESVSSFQPAIKSCQSVRKSASSVRFADYNLPNSTSDYSSMEMIEDTTILKSNRGNEFEMTTFNQDTTLDVQDNVEVTTPNYLLLVGGHESHTVHVIKKPLSIWRLRVTSELFCNN